jgi:hypothetical protein
MKNSIKQVIEILKFHPGLTEKEIIAVAWGCERKKRHADLIRRGLEKGKIHRVKSYSNNKKVFIYFVKVK